MLTIQTNTNTALGTLFPLEEEQYPVQYLCLSVFFVEFFAFCYFNLFKPEFIIVIIIHYKLRCGLKIQGKLPWIGKPISWKFS